MRWLRFILSHSLFIAICAVALVFQTAILLHISVSIALYAFTFCATLCSYNFYWLLSSWSLTRQTKSNFFRSHISNFIVFFIAFAGLAYCLFFLQAILMAIFGALLFTLLYAVPLMPFKFLRFTRKAGFLKTIILAFTWAYVTVYIPASADKSTSGGLFWSLFINRFLFMLMLCIIFDARDQQVDKLRGLHSLATDVKPTALAFIMTTVFTAYIINGIGFRLYYGELAQIIALLSAGAITAIVYLFSLKKQGYYFYYFIVDGLMLLSAMLTGFASI